MTLVYRQADSHVLEISHGFGANLHLVQRKASFAAAVTVDPVYAGRCARLNDDEEFELGLPADSAVYMPIMLFGNSDDFDVRNYGGDVTAEQDAWVGATPSGNVVGYPTCSGMEFATTEFEPEATAGAYVPNNTLTATASNTDSTTGGRVTKGTIYTHQILGIVSRPVSSASNGKTLLFFWGVCIPPTP